MTFPSTLVLFLAAFQTYMAGLDAQQYENRQLIPFRNMRIAISGEILSNKEQFHASYLHFRVENPIAGTDNTIENLRGVIFEDSSEFYGYLFVSDKEQPYSSFFTAAPLLAVRILNSANQTVVRAYVEEMAIFSDSDFNFTIDDPVLILRVSVTLFCSGYGGPNCNSICPDHNLETELCDPVDAIIKTKNPANLTNCSNTFCSDRGLCYLTSDGQEKKCACFTGFMGYHCETPVCSYGCNTSHGVCLNNGRCVCFIGYSGYDCDTPICDDTSICANGGICNIINNAHVCRCDRTRYAGTFCQYRCEPRCTSGECILLGPHPVCLVEADEYNGTLFPSKKKKIGEGFRILDAQIFAGTSTVIAVILIIMLLCIRKYYNDLGNLKSKVISGVKDNSKSRIEHRGGSKNFIASKM